MKLVQMTAISGTVLAVASAACGGSSQSGAAQRDEARAQEARQDAREAAAEAGKARQQAAQARADAQVADQARHDAEQRAEAATLRAQQEEARADREAAAHDARGQAVPRAGVTERQPERAVLFALGSAVLSHDARVSLDELARSIRARGEGHGVVVEGYTDIEGSDATNASLSQQRADAVADYLASRGIARDHITAMGLGTRNPVSREDSVHGRALNRRAEILIKP